MGDMGVRLQYGGHGSMITVWGTWEKDHSVGDAGVGLQSGGHGSRITVWVTLE